MKLKSKENKSVYLPQEYFKNIINYSTLHKSDPEEIPEFKRCPVLKVVQGYRD